MGFFSLRSQTQKVSDVAHNEDYVKKAQRLPSAGEGYENPGFDAYFQNKEEYDAQIKNLRLHRSKSTRSRLFGMFFIKKKADPSEREPILLIDAETNEGDPKNPFTTEVTQAQSEVDGENIFEDEHVDHIEEGILGKDIKRHGTFSRRFTWRFRKVPDSKSLTEQLDKKEYFTKRSTFRSLFHKKRNLATKEDESEDSDDGCSVYDVHETLTQRYMTPSGNGYERLLKDMDEIPFSLTVDDCSTFHKKVSKLIQSISPLRKSPNLDRDADDNASDGSWNPYNIAKRAQKAKQEQELEVEEPEDIFEKASIIDSKEQDKTPLRKPSRFGSLRKSFSLRRSGTKKNIVVENDKDHAEDGKAAHNFQNNMNFAPCTSGDTTLEDPFSSDSSTTVIGNEGFALFEKLYSKTLDVAEKELKLHEEEVDYSGTTQQDCSASTELNFYGCAPEPLSAISNKNDITANFAGIQNRVCDYNDISPFQEVDYDPSIHTKEDASRIHSFGLKKATLAVIEKVEMNPFEEVKEVSSRSGQFLKQLEGSKKDIEELKFLIKRDKSHYRKDINRRNK